MNAVVLNADVRDMKCADIVRAMKASAPTVPIVVISGLGHTSNCGPVDHQLSSYEPQELLNLLKTLFG